MKMAIDGNANTGAYRGDCECGFAWNGQALSDVMGGWSPAYPVAESIVHMKLAHPDQLLDLRFSERMKRWMIDYWTRADLHVASELHAWYRARLSDGTNILGQKV